ncbi:hypothetical protein A2757_01555 [Candidatus Giovannonibacteria bacterium RIFCSPHIGHO2_01_FULL_48_47]|nr:MAG: hypothetical protein A2757_01555 [Candidatus Giovannonibacteria bacterium RIFCSPHIGHO2_01_FULL_48_47]OGF68411.1 MAG: hypothetical protein A3D61_00845 [Candidatus Giovannonibacteria bacterium RIFCSPHIGHO2_02_FULL_48_15]OGF88007.1 MAG: hypothetical protein A3B26_03900 [Candidatus Giovannonibacteria bacterium RIFCSPLOWO2_01_FULL_48_47]OGF94894.1 MAG: hypothetical protein A2433_00890 [Candidatus Giovannonibacteria bacterium RIFOXYC1_FULL_48_8]OGF96133.1 MAG: hypothetical protein A2613_01010
MIIASHQPNHLPNLGFFYKMAKAELFVIITNLQFEKQEGWQQRHKIKGPNGDIWLTVPVFGSQNQRIKEVKINNELGWAKKHKRTMELTYKKSAEKELISKILEVYDQKWERLADLNLALIKIMKEELKIPTPLAVDEEVEGNKETLLINVCKKYGGDVYLSGLGAKDYLNEERLAELRKNNIAHRFVEKNITREYPYSTLHYLLTEGPKWTSNIISS